jgi:apolipoprotein N-acyltransferase
MGAALGAVAGAATTACAIAVFSRVVWPSSLLGWVFLVPWLAALDGTRSVRGALGAGLLMSVAFGAFVFPWFPRMLADYTGAPWAVGAAVLLVIAPVIEPQFVTLALARHLAARAPAARWWWTALVGGGAYVGTEWAWPKLLADTLGHGLHASAWLRQAADVFGAHGLTLALIVGNECALAAVRATRLPPRWPRDSPPTEPSGCGSSTAARRSDRSRSPWCRPTSRTTTG